MEAVFFQLRTDGTGATIGEPVQIGKMPGTGALSYSQPEYRKTQQGGLIRWEIDVPVVPIEPTNNSFDIDLMRDGVNAYLSDVLTMMNFAPVEVHDLPNGETFVTTRKQQSGDLIVKDFSSSRTIDTGVVLSDARVIEDSLMMAGGVVLRFVFIKPASLQLPSQRWVSFRVRAGGTGAETSRINLTDNGAQSSRLTRITPDPDGILRRVTVRTWYRSESGTRNYSSILAYVETMKSALKWSPPVIKTNNQGRGIVLNTRDNFGDLTLDASYNGSAVATLIQNATLEDARVVGSDGAGGVEVEYVFITVPAEHRPTLRYFRFRILNNGTGAHRKTVPLGVNDPESGWLGELEMYGQGKLTVAKVRVWMPNDHGATTLLNVQAKAVGVANDCEFVPPQVKDLPRGKAIMPNIHNNFGALMYHTSYVSDSSNTGTVVLSNCTMYEPPQVFDSRNEDGVGMQFTFARVSDSSRVVS